MVDAFAFEFVVEVFPVEHGREFVDVFEGEGWGVFISFCKDNGFCLDGKMLWGKSMGKCCILLKNNYLNIWIIGEFFVTL